MDKKKLLGRRIKELIKKKNISQSIITLGKMELLEKGQFLVIKMKKF